MFVQLEIQIQVDVTMTDSTGCLHTGVIAVTIFCCRSLQSLVSSHKVDVNYWTQCALGKYLSASQTMIELLVLSLIL